MADMGVVDMSAGGYCQMLIVFGIDLTHTIMIGELAFPPALAIIQHVYPGTFLVNQY